MFFITCEEKAINLNNVDYIEPCDDGRVVAHTKFDQVLIMEMPDKIEAEKFIKFMFLVINQLAGAPTPALSYIHAADQMKSLRSIKDMEAWQDLYKEGL